MGVPGKASFWQTMLAFHLSFFPEICGRVKNNNQKMEQQTPVEHEVKAIQTGKSWFLRLWYAVFQKEIPVILEDNFCFLW